MLKTLNLENSYAKKKYHYCTLFDKGYLVQGLALFNSLERVGGDFNLYVLAMDEVCFEFLKKLDKKNLIPIQLDEILNKSLLKIRERTNIGQFCWVCQPEVCDYVMRIYGVEMITYLDADQYFFSSPNPLFDELGDASVSLVPHNYEKKLDQAENSGIYCVQFNVFRRDKNGYAAINEWRNACSLYSKKAPYQFPGQKNLDLWPKKLNGIKVIENVGAGVAPWNVNKFTLTKINNVPMVNGMPVVFYHFHQYKKIWFGMHLLTRVRLNPEIIEYIYKPYILEMRKITDSIDFKGGGKFDTLNNKSYKSKKILYVSILKNLLSVLRYLKAYRQIYKDSYFK